MTITFRIDDGHANVAVLPTIITSGQMGTLRELLTAEGARRALDLLLPEYGEVSDPSFSFDARICPLALASVAKCFDYFPDVITVLDEAQFRGRRIRIWKTETSADIWLTLSSAPDAAPELNVSDINAYAILDLLGLDRDRVGLIPLSELRSRLSDPVVHRRLNAEPELDRYLPALNQMARLKPIDGELHLAWA